MKVSPLFAATALLWSPPCLLISATAQGALAPESSLLPNGNFEAEANADGTPDGWSAAKGSISYASEGGNHFLRLVAQTPGQMVSTYRQIALPQGVKALELSWKQRATDLKPGSEAWFDARIMMEWKDAQGNKIQGAPSPPYVRKDTHGWVTKSQSFLVPEGARVLEFMPALFRVERGTFELDDIALKPTDPAPIEAANRDRAQANALRTARRDEQLNARLAATGSFITNGDFETDANGDGVPDQWSHPKESVSYQSEGGNHFLRLTSTKKFKMVLSYHLVFLPSNAKAIEISWKQRVSNLKVGEQNFHDARIMMDFTDDTGHKTRTGPTLSATSIDTSGWEQKSQSLLVPERAGGVAFMPALFKVESGIFDLDDLSIKPIDPSPLLATSQAEGAKAIPLP